MQMSREGSIGIANHTKFYWHKSLQQLQHYVKGGLFLFDTLSPFPYAYVLTGNVDPLQGGTKVTVPIHGANHFYREKLFLFFI